MNYFQYLEEKYINIFRYFMLGSDILGSYVFLPKGHGFFEAQIIQKVNKADVVGSNTQS